MDYKFTDIALKDLDDIYNYICFELCNINAAKKLFVDITNTIKFICLFPYMHPDCRCFYIGDINVRYTTINNYILIYRVSDDFILIIRLIHSKQDFVKLLKNTFNPF